MKYTAEQQEIYKKMFKVTNESTSYAPVGLGPNGMIELHTQAEYQSTSQACITLSSGDRYLIDYDEQDDVEMHTIKAFNRFVELNYDEEAFEEYLITESAFTFFSSDLKL